MVWKLSQGQIRFNSRRNVDVVPLMSQLLFFLLLLILLVFFLYSLQTFKFVSSAFAVLWNLNVLGLQMSPAEETEFQKLT